jgi:3-hydroxybutyrate dehydrogenase
MRLEGKVAIVTGAARGIGAAIAGKFAAEGARVAICDIDGAAARRTAATLANSAIGVAMDVTDEAAVDAGVAEVVERLGPPDVLVANAGIQIVHPVEQFPFAEWKRLLSIHLDGAFLTTKACLPHMYAKRAGSIIYMGSVLSKDAAVLKAAYTTAKHGLIGLAQVVAKEGAAHGVRANVICPSFVMTELVRKQIPEQAEALGISEDEVVSRIMLGNTVDKEFTTVEEVAEIATLFASFPSLALTGQSLLVAHGAHME